MVNSPPDFNSDMRDVWVRLFAEAAKKPIVITNDLVDTLIVEYNVIETNEREKGDEARLLLPVSWHYANIWLDRQLAARNNLSAKGHITPTAATIARNLQSTLREHDIQPNPVQDLDIAATGVIAKTATKLSPLQRKESTIRKRKRQQCATCRKYFGSNVGEHPRGQCPEITEDARQQQIKKKENTLEKKKQTKEDLLRRQGIALLNIGTNKFPETLASAKGECEGRNVLKCLVCNFTCKRSSNPERNPNWHVFKYNNCLYCPFADSEELRNSLAAKWRAKADKKNSSKRSKRSTLVVNNII